MKKIIIILVVILLIFFFLPIIRKTSLCVGVSEILESCKEKTIWVSLYKSMK
ncbi:MAG: hypothetical protein WC264_00060 [Candidatus Paceibacterota bacterium]|jgi:hypothetical protein